MGCAIVVLQMNSDEVDDLSGRRVQECHSWEGLFGILLLEYWRD